MRIYMDVCCFNRPYDDETQDRIRFEAEAVRTILSYCEERGWTLVGSFAIHLEISRTPDKEKRQKLTAFLQMISEQVTSDNKVDRRAMELKEIGFRTFDALHIALAEKADADVFLTTDDRLLKRAMRCDSNIKVPVANPMKWLLDEGEWHHDNDSE